MATNGYYQAGMFDLLFMEQNIERIENPGIHVTRMKDPDSGWPMAFYCPLCKATTFALSPYAIKPTEGDYLKVNGMCMSEEHGHRHNMQMALDTLTETTLWRIG